MKLTDDTVEIKWSTMRKESRVVGQNSWGIDQYEAKYVEDILGHIVVYSYTKTGYAKLSGYVTNDGHTYIPEERVNELWGEEMQSRLREIMPACVILKLRRGFSYSIPLSTKSLF